MAKTKRKPQDKGRNFAFILYPESMPDDWLDRLAKVGAPMEISPLHDKDKKSTQAIAETVNIMDFTPEEMAKYQAGEMEFFKKPHYHVIYIAANPVTANSVRNKISRALGKDAISHVEIVDNVEYYHLYLTHESSDAIKKKKHKYDKADIRQINGFDIDRYITLDDFMKKELFNSLVSAVYTHKLENIMDLADFVLEHGSEIGVPTLDVMNDVLASRSGLIRLYFDGSYQRRTRGTAVRIDPETGEVLSDKK